MVSAQTEAIFNGFRLCVAANGGLSEGALVNRRNFQTRRLQQNLWTESWFILCVNTRFIRWQKKTISMPSGRLPVDTVGMQISTFNGFL